MPNYSLSSFLSFLFSCCPFLESCEANLFTSSTSACYDFNLYNISIFTLELWSKTLSPLFHFHLSIFSCMFFFYFLQLPSLQLFCFYFLLRILRIPTFVSIIPKLHIFFHNSHNSVELQTFPGSDWWRAMQDVNKINTIIKLFLSFTFV